MRWEVMKWKDVLEIRSGRSQKEVESPVGNYPIYGSGGKIMGYAKDFLCEAGTTIIGRKGSINQPFFIEEPFWNVDTAFGLHNGERLTKRFLFYFCLSFDFTSRDKGSGRPSLVKTDLYEMVMPIPPIKEQERIVEVLDEAFAAIDKAKANIERNLTNARELFQSRLNDIFSNPSEDWVEQSLDELGRVQSGGTPSRGKSAYWNDGVIEWYSSRELNQEWTLPSKEKITIEGLENSNAKLFSAGSLLIGIYDTAAMKMSILTEESAFNQAIVGVEFDKNIDVRFMRFQLMVMSDEIRSQRRGTRQQNLSLKKIKDVSVLVPELTVQNKVVQSIGLLRNAVHAIESKYQSEIENLEELRQSILEQAFEGKLTEPVAA